MHSLAARVQWLRAARLDPRPRAPRAPAPFFDARPLRWNVRRVAVRVYCWHCSRVVIRQPCHEPMDVVLQNTDERTRFRRVGWAPQFRTAVRKSPQKCAHNAQSGRRVLTRYIEEPDVGFRGVWSTGFCEMRGWLRSWTLLWRAPGRYEVAVKRSASFGVELKRARIANNQFEIADANVRISKAGAPQTTEDVNVVEKLRAR